MSCNLGTEKMPIILDQPESDSNSASQGVFHAIELRAQDHISNQNLTSILSNKNYKDVNIRMSEQLKQNFDKNCINTKKVLDESLKKYSTNLVSPDFTYNPNELLNFSSSENQQEKEIPVSLKVEQKKCKKKVKQKDVSFHSIATHNDGPGVQVQDVESMFMNKGKESCREKGKKGKGKEKLSSVRKCHKLIAPHPSGCDGQDGMTAEKPMQKINYSMNPGTNSSEIQKEFEEHQITDETDKCMKLHDYSGYDYSEKRQGDVYMQTNLLSDFESFSKESKLNDLKSKNSGDLKLKCFKCYNCSFMSLNMDCLNYHSQKKDKCFNNSETFHCPGCKNVFYSLTPLRVHLVYDHKMLQREVKLILQNIQGISYEKMDIQREKLPFSYESENEMMQNGNLFTEGISSTADMSMQSIDSRDGVSKTGFVQLPTGRSITGGRELEPSLNKRQTMLESYLDDISNKGDCSLPPSLTQNGSDLLENTFNFTAPVSEQLPSIQPPPAHSSSNGLMEHPHLIINEQESHGYVGVAHVYPEHRVEEAYKPNEGDHYDGGGNLMIANGNYLQHQIHDIPVINLDENHLAKPSENILSQEINMDDFPSYNENGLQPLEEEENECRLSVEDDDQEEKKKLKKMGVGYRCDINGCKVRLQSEKNIQYHRRCHEGTLYNCPECCKDCSTWVSLSSHLWQAHKIDMELYKCDQCPYKTPSYSRLTNIHRGIHGKARPFLCDVCGKGFKTVKQMRNHKNIHKAKMVRMSVCHCEICGRTVADKRQLELHINNTHKKKKPYLCYMCGYASAVKHSLVVHMRRHTGEKPYECEKCEYKTADHNALRRHKMKHTGVRNYKCNHCSYTCIQASTYKVHIKTKHPGLETDVIFGCGLCSFQTLNRGSFLSHTSEHENYNAQIRKQTRCPPAKQTSESTGGEFYSENNLVGPIISERVVETIRDLSGAQTLLEDDLYERITDDLENSQGMKCEMSESDMEDAIIELYEKGKWMEMMETYSENTFLPWVWPSRQDLEFIGEAARRSGSVRIVSVGCGSGLLEWLISKSTGINVVGIELDKSWWTSKYAKKTFIPVSFLEDPHNSHEAANSGDAMLLFCYFNNEKAFVRYMEDFKGNCFLVIGPGPKKSRYTVPEPFSLPRIVDSKWKLTESREIGQSEDYIAVYSRIEEL